MLTGVSLADRPRGCVPLPGVRARLPPAASPGPGVARLDERDAAGERLRDPPGEGVHPRGEGGGAVLRRVRAVLPAQPGRCPDLRGVPRGDRPARRRGRRPRPVPRGTGRRAGGPHPRGVRRLQRVPRDAFLPDDGDGVGDQPPPAGELRHGADQRVSAASRGVSRRGDGAHRGGDATRRGCVGVRDRGAAASRGPRPRLLPRGDGRGEALRGVSFSARKGEVLGLVGPTGGGKSTLFSLLSGLYPAPPGTVFLEGIDASTIPLPDLRRRFAVVSQDPFLFSDSDARERLLRPRTGRSGSRQKGDRSRPLPRRGRGDAERVRHRRGGAGDLPLGGAEAARHDRACALRRAHPSCCWTTPSPPWTPRRSGRSSRGSSRKRGSGRSCSARTGWPPSPGATGSSCWRRPDRRGGDARRPSLPARRLLRPVLPPDARPRAGGVVVKHGPDDFFTDDRVETRGIDRRLLARLLRYVLPHRRLLAAALAALLCGTACQLAGPYLIKIFIDRYVMTGRLSGMGGWILLYFGALVGAMGFLYLQMYAVSILGQRVILALRREMFARMQRLPVVFFDRTPTGRLMTRLTSDVEALQELLSSGLVSTIGDVAVLAGTAAILLWMDPRLALVTFSVLPVLVLFVELLKKRIREANREMRRKLARMNAFLQEHVTGVAVVKTFGMEGKSERRFDALNGEYAAESVRLTNLYSVYFPGVEMLASIARGAAAVARRRRPSLGRGHLRHARGVPRIRPTVLRPDPGHERQVQHPADRAGLFGTDLPAPRRRDLSRIRGSRARIRARFPAVASPARLRTRGRVPGRLVFLPAARGRGDSRGSGRTAGPARGILHPRGRPDRCDRGRDGGREDDGPLPAVPLLRDPPREDPSLRAGHPRDPAGGAARVARPRPPGHVSSSPGRCGRTSRRAARRSGPRSRRSAWNDSPEEWCEGLATDVGERGVRLSTGQRQMVSFARALAREPRVLLLDEATSSVDPVTEGRIQEALAGILPGRTALVVAHRLSTVLSAGPYYRDAQGESPGVGDPRRVDGRGGDLPSAVCPPV